MSTEDPTCRDGEFSDGRRSLPVSLQNAAALRSESECCCYPESADQSKVHKKSAEIMRLLSTNLTELCKVSDEEVERLSATNSELEEHRVQIEALERENSEKDRVVAYSESKIAALERKLTVAEEEWKEKDGIVEYVTNWFDRTKHMVPGAIENDESGDEESELTLAEKMRNFPKKCDAFTAALEKREKEHGAVLLKFLREKQSQNELERRLSDAEQNLQASRVLIASKDAQLHDEGEIARRISEKLKATEEELAEARKEVLIKDEELKEARSEVSVSRKQLDETHKELSLKDEELTEARAVVSARDTELTTQRDQFIAEMHATSEKSEMKLRNERLRVKKLEEELQKSNWTLINLREELQLYHHEFLRTVHQDYEQHQTKSREVTKNERGGVREKEENSDETSDNEGSRIREEEGDSDQTSDTKQADQSTHPDVAVQLEIRRNNTF